jgi:hypothetical protein
MMHNPPLREFNFQTAELSSLQATFVFNEISEARLSSSITMVPMTQCDAGALEHILSILLARKHQFFLWNHHPMMLPSQYKSFFPCLLG